MQTQSTNIMDQIEQFKKDFYQTNGKNTFFKKTQKQECANLISQTFDINEMIQKTVYVIPGTNQVFFDYTIFKLYANDSNYEPIVNAITSIYDLVLLQYPNFVIHIDLNTFSVSAADRYKPMIQLFCQKCMNSDTKYSELISHMYLYNTPAMIDTIMTVVKPFVDPNIIGRITKYTKEESAEQFRKLNQK